jgi:excisionase family DNA binding protein
MQLSRHQIEAAHALGEALMRFLAAIPTTRSDASEQTTLAKHSEGPSEEDRLLRIGEVAELLAISKSKVYELTYGGHLPSVKVGSARRFRLSAVRKFMAERTGGSL